MEQERIFLFCKCQGTHGPGLMLQVMLQVGTSCGFGTIMPDVVFYFCDSLFLLMTPSRVCASYTHNSLNAELMKRYLSVGSRQEALPSETAWLESRWWGRAVEIKMKSIEKIS